MGALCCPVLIRKLSDNFIRDNGTSGYCLGRLQLLPRCAGRLGCFANGAEVDPHKISLRLVRVFSDTIEADIFRVAALTWSVPVSPGFGRRLRYLVWDDYHNKVVGIIALGDPVFNLSVRDELIGWNVKDRTKRLVNLLDAYVLGSVPPYNMLLGGKAVACLVRSREVFNDFKKTYGDSIGIISGKAKRAKLLAVTTTSSLGRSSVYNRLRLGDTISANLCYGTASSAKYLYVRLERTPWKS